MKEKFARLIVEQNSALELYEDYSGRGMYGKSTFGVVGDADDVANAAAEALEELIDSIDEEFLEPVWAHHVIERVNEEVREWMRDVFAGRRDSMGLDVIWY